MASNTSLKFYKFNSSTGDYASRVSNAKAVEGAIIYLVDVHELWVGGSTPQLALKGASEVSFANNMLTVTTYNGTGTPTTQTLDFSDTASASATLNVFKHITYDLIGAVQSGNPATTTLDYSTTAYLQGVQTLAAADKRLDTEIKTVWDAVQTAGKVDEVQINGTDIVDNKVANILTDGTYVTTGTQNLIATQSTVTNAIAALDETDSKGDASISGSTITIQGVKQTDGKIIDGDVTTINLDGTYNETSNKIATQSTVINAIGDLDVSDFAMAAVDGNKIQIKGLKEEDGKVTSIGTTGNNGAVEILLDGNYSATSGSENLIATQSTVANAVAALDGSATIATVSNGVVTLKAGVTETDGVITNSSDSDITLAKVAATGSADDVTIGTGVHYASQTVSATVQDITNRVIALEELPDFDTIVSSDAATTPAGVTWDDQGTTITGSLAASATTMHKIYLVPTDGTTPNVYREYITLHNGNTYSWEKIGDTEVDLTGYAKSVTVNGQQYTAGSGTDINIGNAITSVDGETAISSGNSEFVAVTATTSAAASGAQGVTLASKVKLQSVNTASSSAQGLAEASDVKNYVDTQITSAVQDLDVSEFALAEKNSSTNVITIHGISETNGEIAVGANSANDVTLAAVAATGNASDVAYTNSIGGQSVTNVDDALDALVTQSGSALQSFEIDGVQSVTGTTAEISTTGTSGGTGAITPYDATNNPVATKAYVDAHTANVVQGTQTLTVNDANPTTLATVDGTDIVAKVSLVWEEYV